MGKHEPLVGRNNILLRRGSTIVNKWESVRTVTEEGELGCTLISSKLGRVNSPIGKATML